MRKPFKLSDVHYFDRQIGALKRLVDHLVESARHWREMPSYERFGRLEYMSQLQMYLDHIRGGIKRGELTQRQVREFRNLERLSKDALGTIKILKARDAEMLARERREGE